MDNLKEERSAQHKRDHPRRPEVFPGQGAEAALLMQLLLRPDFGQEKGQHSRDPVGDHGPEGGGTVLPAEENGIQHAGQEQACLTGSAAPAGVALGFFRRRGKPEHAGAYTGQAADDNGQQQALGQETAEASGLPEDELGHKK